jgi:hypothetical protein
MTKPHQKLPRWLVLVTWLLSTVAVIGTALAPAPPPPDWQHWAVLVLAAAVLGWFSTASGLVLPVVPHPPWNVKWRPLVLPAAVVTVAVVATLGLTWVNGLRRGCGPPVSVAILTTPDLAATVVDLTRRYQAGEMVDGCPVATLNVTSADPELLESALRGRWPNDGGFRALGARPALVIDERSVAEAAYRAHAGAESVPSSTPGPSVVAHSPLVLAVPGTAPGIDAAPWRETVDDLSSRGYSVLRPEPSSSVVGSLALALDYPDDGPAPAGRVDDDRAHENRYAEAFEKAGVGVRADVPTTVRHALCRTGASTTASRGVDAPAKTRDLRLALVMPEFLIADKDGARQSAARVAGCSVQQWPRFDRVRSTDTASVRLTTARLHWTDEGDCSSARCPRQIADGFATWLDTDSTGGRALVDLGWRLNDDASPNDATDVETAEDRYQAARTRARVVIAVDSSLSMRPHQRAVQDSVGALMHQLRAQDRVRFCTFVRRPGADQRACPDAEATPATDQHKEGVIASIAGTKHTFGNAPLADVLDRTLRDLGEAADGERNTIVVVTDVGGLNVAGAWPRVLETAKKYRTEIVAVLPAGSVPIGVDQVTRNRVPVVTLDPGSVGEIAATLWRSAA